MNEKLNYTDFDIFSIKDNKLINEAFIEDIIKNKPSKLNLGNLSVIDNQRKQTRAGILDLLLENERDGTLYTVEIQLGKTDPSHIIRTIEYWDNERKRYPDNKYIAVIVAEDITSRFFNVISLFNRAIPIIAINMTAIKFENKFGLIFTTILDLSSFIPVEVNNNVEPATETYWIEKGSQKTFDYVKSLLTIIHEIDDSDSFQLTFLKYYIGLGRNNKPMNFASFIPRKKHLQLQLRLDFNALKEEEIDSKGLNLLKYDTHWKKYIINLTEKDIDENKDYLKVLLKEAYDKMMHD